jgi:hypothetical protein
MPRDIILARRARFIAAGLAALSVVACSGDGEPQPCLAPVGGSGGTAPDASTGGTGGTLVDAAADGTTDSEAGGSGGG